MAIVIRVTLFRPGHGAGPNFVNQVSLSKGYLSHIQVVSLDQVTKPATGDYTM